jgi:hypothetical protein
LLDLTTLCPAPPRSHSSFFILAVVLNRAIPVASYCMDEPAGFRVTFQGN